MREVRKRGRIVTVRKPGQPGTKKLLQIYGPTLRCVRYVKDYDTGERYKSIELIQVISHDAPAAHVAPDVWVGIEIKPGEKELRREVKAAGGRYDTYDRLWFVRFEDYKRLCRDERRFTIKEEVAEYRV
jgi:hypothetical protein